MLHTSDLIGMHTEKLGHSKYLLFAAIVGSIVFDIANFLLQRIAGGTGTMIAAGKTAVICLLLVSYKRKSSFLFFFVILFLGLLRIAYNAFAGNEVYTEDFVFLFRFQLTIGFLLAFRDVSSSLMIKIARFLMAVMIVQCLSVILAFLLKIEMFRAYVWRDGYKGLFVHINDEAFMMAAGLLLCISQWHECKSRRWLMLAALIVVALFVMGMGSRTALVGAIIVPLIYGLVVFLKRPLRPPLVLAVALACFGAVSIGAVVCFWDIIQRSIVVQLIALYYRSGSIVNAITTGRDVHIAEYFASLDSPFPLLLGSYIPKSINGSQMLESDLFDLMFRFGVWIFPILFLLVISISKRAFIEFRPALLSYLLMVLLIGGMTGHVLISSQNSLWFSFYFWILVRNPFKISVKHQ